MHFSHPIMIGLPRKNIFKLSYSPMLKNSARWVGVGFRPMAQVVGKTKEVLGGSEPRGQPGCAQLEKQLRGNVKAFAEPCNVIFVQFALAAQHLRDDTRCSEHVNQILLSQVILIHEKHDRLGW